MSASWRDVPIPASVACLPRNSAGRPVPANVAWYEPDDDGSILVERDPELGEHVTCRCTPGRGTPRFGEQCPVRQRQFMLHRKRGLCTEAIEPTAQLVFVGETNARYYLEPALHQLSAAYALQVCPVLHEAGEIPFPGRDQRPPAETQPRGIPLMPSVAHAALDRAVMIASRQRST